MIIYWTRHSTHADRRIRYFWPFQQFIAGSALSGGPPSAADGHYGGFIVNMGSMRIR